MLRAKFSLDGQGALYEQLARALKQAILDGHLRAGERLPGTRAMADTLGLSRNTVMTAYEILRAEQLTSSNERSGTRVAPLTSAGAPSAPPVAAPQSRYSERVRRLAAPRLDHLRDDLRYDLHVDMPIAAEMMRSWNRKLAAAAHLAGPRYPDAKGYLPLRTVIAEHLARRRGVACTEDDVLVVSGTQQAITITARAVLDEGDTVAIEDPHCLDMTQTLSAHGARIVSIRTDDVGMRTGDLAHHKPKLICVSPSDQFPSGVVMSLERRMELLEIASRQGSWVLEDDHNGEFSRRERRSMALRSLDFGGRVIYVGTFSKTLYPGLRLGYMICPPGIREDFCAAKRFDDLGNPSVEQAALAALIRSRQYDKHLRHTLVELERRRDAFIESLRRHCGDRVEIQRPPGKTHVVVWLREVEYGQVPRLVELGVERNLGFYPIHPYYDVPPQRPGLVLGYAALPAGSLERVGALFGQCLDELSAMPRGHH